MDSTSTVERLGRTLESEEAADNVLPIPADGYVRLAGYVQKLRATSGSGDEDIVGRLARKQTWLIEAMTRRLLQVRLAKAQKEATMAGDVKLDNLLPEERYLRDLRATLKGKEERLVRAVADGQPSFFTLVQRREARRMTTVRMASQLGEIIGADLKRYGPFEVNDVARLPTGNAQAMVANRQAVPLQTDEY